MINLLSLKDNILAFTIGFILSGLFFIWENHSIKKMNKSLVSSLEQSTALVNSLIITYSQEIEKKEGEKSNE
jgi:hypothetical protein